MEIEKELEFLIPLIDKQFEMLGVPLRFKGIPEDQMVMVGKKKDYWYNLYRFTEEQEKEWMKWAEAELKKKGREKYFYLLNMTYGLPIKYKKEGELF